MLTWWKRRQERRELAARRRAEAETQLREATTLHRLADDFRRGAQRPGLSETERTRLRFTATSLQVRAEALEARAGGDSVTADLFEDEATFYGNLALNVREPALAGAGR
jgi:hypothetical protein